MDGGAAHIPVLAAEAVDLLVTDPGGTYVDGTFGAGGHTRLMLQRLNGRGRVLGLDVDGEILQAGRARFASELQAKSLALFHCNFSQLDTVLERENCAGVQGILVDLGVSSWQLNTPERGFSFQHDGPLDMRMDRSVRGGAADIVNRWDERELSDMIFRYGEERNARRIARLLCERRQRKPFTTTAELAAAIEERFPRRGARIHPATRTFQALRIAVNRELESLERFLQCAPGWLAAGGRVGVISFHSLEDRMVKHAFRHHSKEGNLRILTKKPIQPGGNEVANNPRSRSAKLRVAEKTSGSRKEVIP